MAAVIYFGFLPKISKDIQLLVLNSALQFSVTWTQNSFAFPSQTTTGNGLIFPLEETWPRKKIF